MTRLKLNIPVKTYVRKYIEAHYPPPFVLTTTNSLGSYVYVVMEKSTSHWHKKADSIMTKRYELLSDHITVWLPKDDNIIYRHGLTVPPAKSILINDFFEENIIREIHIRCNLYSRSGLSRNKAIDDFCDDYGINLDRDITHAAFKKAEYRYRSRKNKLLPHVSPHKNNQLFHH